jgi:tricorn protease
MDSQSRSSRLRGHPAVAVLVCLVTIGLATAAGAVPAYFHHPDVYGDRIVFCAESDLWTASLQGGTPQRLTTDPGTEYFPAFSPDGRQIAFTGEYDGNRDVYLMPASGGEPRRLTWHPAADEVVGWMPDGERIIFRSNRSDPHGSQHLFTVDLNGGDPVELPLSWAVRLDVDPQSGLWAFNRKSREYATWKRYRGGTASEIWVGDPERRDFRPVTTFAGIDHFPMWHDGRIYFLSDQGGTYNIWSIKPDGSDRERHTNFDQWDVGWPSMGPDGKIVFTLAADVHLFDPASGQTRKIDIDLPSDRDLTRTRYPDAGRYLTEFDLSPDGERLLVVTRGEMYSVPVEDGVTLPVSHATGARERSASFGPEGERILYITDEPGEDEFRTIDAWGRGEPTVVKKAGKSGWHHQPVMSPDGKWIAYADNSYALFVMPAEGGKPVEIARNEEGAIREYVWSPDGRWLAYVNHLPSEYSSLFIYDTKEKESHAVTGPFTEDHSPTWDPDGRYLYFMSARATNPVLGDTDFTNVEIKNNMLYMVLLREDVENPLLGRAGLPPAADEKDKDSKDEKKDDKKDEKGDKGDKGDKDEEAIEPIEIDLDGLADRVVELPVDRGNYAGLGATSSHLFFMSLPIKGMAEQAGIFQEEGPEAVLISFDLKKKEAQPFVEGIGDYVLAPKAGKVAIMKQKGDLYVVDAAAPPGGGLAEGKVDLSDVVVELDPRQEWAQIYYEAWRQMREYYWDEHMAGVDWAKVRDQYASLLPRLGSRADLTDLIGQIFGEMNTSHTYVFGGDPGVRVEHRRTGLLGADLVREGDAYRVERIYRGDPADRVRSPLDEPGVSVKEGDYILAVNRVPVTEGRPLYAHLQNLAGKEVVLSVGDKPGLEDAREVVVVPLGNERDLRYSDWVRRNREYVAEKTGGKIGYIHIPNMWTEGLVEFNTWFYPQLDKEGMVVDVRWNGGGAVSQMIVERLRRHVLSFALARGGDVSTYPDRVLNGPFVVLTNEFAGSDGDIFPQAIQLEGLAPVIGMRSWGGVVGIRSLRPLVDGGLVTNPEVAWWDPRDRFHLENRGVEPDIEVQNLPQDLARGQDAQLDRGIAEVMRLHEQKPPLKPDFSKARDRGRKAFQGELKN